MALVKREYKDSETVITAENLNAIQDAIIALEDGLVTVDDDKSGEAIILTDAANRGLKKLKIYGRSALDREPSLDNPANLVSVGDMLDAVHISVCGKNLFTGWDIGGIASGSGVEEGHEDKRRTGFIPVIPGAKYTISNFPATLYTFAAFYDREKDFLERTAAGAFLIGKRTIDAPAQARYMRFTIYESSATAGTINEADVMSGQTMIELGDTATEYVRGTAIQEVYAALSGNLQGIPVFGGGNYRDATGQEWVCDVLDMDAGTETLRTTGILLDGSEPWYYNSGNKYFYTIITDRKKGSNLLCNRLPVNPTLSDQNKIGWWAFNTDNYVFAVTGFINAGLATTVDEFKAYLASHPLYVWYITEAIDEEFQISDAEKNRYKAMHTNKPDTIILNNAGAWMEAEYVVDAKTYIDKKFEELKGEG